MKLSKFITKFIFITAFTSVTLAFLISIIFQYLNFKNDLNHYKKEFTEQKRKEVLEQQRKNQHFDNVNSIADDIKF